MSGPIETNILKKLKAEFAPVFLELHNESSMHNVPKGSESHFRLAMASGMFEGLSRVARQRLVYDCLTSEMKGGVHALTMRLLTPLEWSEAGAVEVESPPCLGGSLADKKR